MKYRPHTVCSETEVIVPRFEKGKRRGTFGWENREVMDYQQRVYRLAKEV